MSSVKNLKAEILITKNNSNKHVKKNTIVYIKQFIIY